MLLPATALENQMLEALEAKGWGDKDHTALFALLDEWAGLSPG